MLLSWGYDRPKYGYRIVYKNASKRQFINADWRLDNFYRDHDGKWTRKRGSDYYGIRLTEDDKHGGVKKEKVHFFELKLGHRRNNGVIWVQIFDLLPKHRDRQLDVLLANYVESLSGTGLFIQSNVYGLLHVKEKKHAALVRFKQWMRLHQYPALRARIDLVNLDRLKVDPKHRGQSVELVLLRFWRTAVKEDYTGKQSTVFHPAIMVIGYKNSVAYFARHRSDLQTFLKQFAFMSNRKAEALSKQPLPRQAAPRLRPRHAPPRKRPQNTPAPKQPLAAALGQP